MKTTIDHDLRVLTIRDVKIASQDDLCKVINNLIDAGKALDWNIDLSDEEEEDINVNVRQASNTG